MNRRVNQIGFSQRVRLEWFVRMMDALLVHAVAPTLTWLLSTPNVMSGLIFMPRSAVLMAANILITPRLVVQVSMMGTG